MCFTRGSTFVKDNMNNLSFCFRFISYTRLRLQPHKKKVVVLLVISNGGWYIHAFISNQCQERRRSKVCVRFERVALSTVSQITVSHFSALMHSWKLRFEGLQCQSNDPWHTAVEWFIFQAHKTVEGQRSSSNYTSDPRVVKSSIILGAQINQNLKKFKRSVSEVIN